ncbi:MAG: DUF1737 domain-containing protein [Verrucomicrobiota bacterium]
MNRISEYKIVTGTDGAEVAQEVNELIKQGFVPTGNISSSFSPNEQKFYLFQTMVKWESLLEKE